MGLPTLEEFDVSLVTRTLLAKKGVTSLDKIGLTVGNGHRVADS